MQTKNIQLLHLLSESLKYYTNIKDDFSPEDIWKIDISKPDLSEASILINIYSNSITFGQLIPKDNDLKNFINYLIGEDALLIFKNFEERISVILPELLKIIQLEATEEDYEELLWQNKLSNSKKSLLELAAKAKQEKELKIYLNNLDI